jgi:hypothetical protein
MRFRIVILTDSMFGEKAAQAQILAWHNKGAVFCQCLEDKINRLDV